MARAGWFRDNSSRCWPFLAGSLGKPLSGPTTLRNLPLATIVDAGFVLGPRSRFDLRRHAVRLTAIRRSGGTFHFDFETDAPALAGVVLTFSRAVGGRDFETSFADTGTGGFSDSASETAGDACEEPHWSGFLSTGNLEYLEELLTTNGTIAGELTTEPTTVQSLAGAAVTSLAAANDDRTRWEPPLGCPDPVWPYETGVTFVSSRCVRGAVTFRPGYNAAVRHSDRGNAIVLSAVPGLGQGEPCDEVPLFSGETPPSGSSLLTGGPACAETFRSINGKTGSLVQIEAGPGVIVTPSPSEHKITIDVSMLGLAVCFGSNSSE